mmetsp:Transcript_14885/g.44845  ORF Transcript_14885/g.44845 Transcript_14885/m.44845 type:complete len:211 (+) Transcript_14885:1291-1923(+)
MIWVATAEQKLSSWLTNTTVSGQAMPASAAKASRFARKASSQRTPCRSRWFVGSSRRITSALLCSAAASLRRILHPPLSSPTACRRRRFLKPRPLSTFTHASSTFSGFIPSSSSSMTPRRSASASMSSSASSSSSSAASTVSRSASSFSVWRDTTLSTRCSNTLCSGSSRRSSSCATSARRRCSGKPGMSPEAMRFSSVDLPTPLRPMSA